MRESTAPGRTGRGGEGNQQRETEMHIDRMREFLPKGMFGLLPVAALAVAFACTLDARRAAAHDWVGPAIVGAIIGGAIVDNAYRHRYWKQHRHYRKPARYHRPRHYRPRYYAPAVVVPLPFLFVAPGW